MTATEGAPALDGAETGAAAPHRDDGRAGATPGPRALAASARARRLRTMLGLARVEASLLVRSRLVLAGLLAGGFAMWLYFRQAEPLWWDAAWRIGWGQLILGTAVLAAGQLAAGRPRRDGLAELYASFPATTATRALAQLAGLAGALPGSLLLAAVVTATLRATGAIGAPDVAVLAGGPLLVIAAGAAGIAIGSRLPHPLAGALGALVLLFSSATSHLGSGAGIWLVPWQLEEDQLASLPGPLAGYPPAAAHVLELAGLAVLAGIVALAVTIARARARAWLAAAGVAAVAVICLAGALQLRPIPTADLNHLVSEVANPATAQRCTTASQVRYCLYAGFGGRLPSLEEPVSAVLARLPARPAQPLTVRQAVSLSLPDATLTHGHPAWQVSRWAARVQRAPGNASAAPASAVYLPLVWPPGGAQLADARFGLALAAAEWAVRLHGTGGIPSSVQGPQPCVPLGQAREAIAIWLAIQATHPPAGQLQNGLGPGNSVQGTEVNNTFVRTWLDPSGGYVTPPGGGPQFSAAGYLLASAMTQLPQQRVSHVLAGAWGRWVNWHTTGAELAAALGIPMPQVATPPLPPGPGPDAGPGQAPLCTS